MNTAPVSYQLLMPLAAWEYDALKADILAHGVQVPVVYDEAGVCLDGHHRLRAVAELRAEGHAVADPPQTVRAGLSEAEKQDFALRINFARRHFTTEQKKAQALRLRGMGWSYRRIAGVMAVDPMTVKRWLDAEAGVANATPDTPATITGADGKAYPARRPAPTALDEFDQVPAPTQPERPAAPDPAGGEWPERVHPLPAPAPAHPARRTDDRQDWTTPQALFELLDFEFGFTLDAAAAPDNAKCATYYTVAENGLARSWGGHVVYCNPPYDAKDLWVRKAFAEAQAGVTVVLLIPATPETRLWWECCRFGEVRFLRGRLRFDDGGVCAPFPSAVVIFRPGLPAADARVVWWEAWNAPEDES